ncbi:MAG: acyl--CoA ligase, partial [Planctomycetes bacterium]|nr:acyl--CoA ligase [Planctomycetota bacterium]
MFTGFEVLPPARLREEVEAATLPRNLGALLDQAAGRHAGTVALSFFDQGIDITWADLAARVERAARGLATLGVRHGSHVAVLLPNVPEFPVAWLALARLGAVMTPVNITYTPREVAYVLADAAVEFLVVHADLLDRVDAIEPAPLPAARVVVVGGPAPAPRRAWDDLPAGAGALPAVDVDP